MGFALLRENATDREIQLDSVRAESRRAGLEAVMIALNEEVEVDSAQAVAAERRARINALRGPYLSRDQATQQIIRIKRGLKYHHPGKDVNECQLHRQLR